MWVPSDTHKWWICDRIPRLCLETVLALWPVTWFSLPGQAPALGCLAESEIHVLLKEGTGPETFLNQL